MIISTNDDTYPFPVFGDGFFRYIVKEKCDGYVKIDQYTQVFLD